MTAGSKKDTKPSLGPGQSDTYTITASNPNNMPLDNFTVLEDLPPELSMVQPAAEPVRQGPAPTIATAPRAARFTNWPSTPAVAAGPRPHLRHRPDPVHVRDRAGRLLDHHHVKAGIPMSGDRPRRPPDHERHLILNCATISGTGTPPVRRCTTQTVQSVAVDLAKTLTPRPVSRRPGRSSTGASRPACRQRRPRTSSARRSSTACRSDSTS